MTQPRPLARSLGRSAATALLVASIALLGGCGDAKKDGPKEPTGPKKHASEGGGGTEEGGHGHGESKSIASLTVGGAMFEVKVGGTAAPGGEAFYDVIPQDDAGKADGAKLSLWFEDANGEMVSPADSKGFNGTSYHGHLAVPAGKNAAAYLKIRFRSGDVDDEKTVPLPESLTKGGGHEHGHGHGAHGPHGGMIGHLHGNGMSGHVELKLHDDKGDLELWLYADGDCKVPFDVSLDANIEATFPELKDRMAELRPRDREKNADESGNANVRDGKTNYFVFPGNTDVDTEWLRGTFSSPVKLTIKIGETVYETDAFTLAPHAH